MHNHSIRNYSGFKNNDDIAVPAVQDRDFYIVTVTMSSQSGNTANVHAQQLITGTPLVPGALVLSGSPAIGGQNSEIQFTTTAPIRINKGDSLSFVVATGLQITANYSYCISGYYAD